ncbi:MAG TPA: hypothetical protein PLF38_05615 [Xylanibacter oryzae]|jgi:hypothetical protein|nr:hypothetical protein [Prevotella sp.]HRN16516.1 hypothetical protein [Xylanibacter oryzae]
MKKIILSAALFVAAVSFGGVVNAQNQKKVENTKECCQKKCDKAKAGAKDAKCKCNAGQKKCAKKCANVKARTVKK